MHCEVVAVASEGTPICAWRHHALAPRGIIRTGGEHFVIVVMSNASNLWMVE